MENSIIKLFKFVKIESSRSWRVLQGIVSSVSEGTIKAYSFNRSAIVFIYFTYLLLITVGMLFGMTFLEDVLWADTLETGCQVDLVSPALEEVPSETSLPEGKPIKVAAPLTQEQLDSFFGTGSSEKCTSCAKIN